MGKSYLDNLVVLEHSKISLSLGLISVKEAVKKYGQEPHNLSIDTENKTWSYGSDGPRSVWVSGHFTKNVGDGGASIYSEGVAGGAGTLVYGAGGYWRYADNWLKFVLSLVGLVALIIFAYWFNKEKKGFWKKFFKGKK